MSVPSVLRLTSRCSAKSSWQAASNVPRAFSVLGPKRLGTPLIQAGATLKGKVAIYSLEAFFAESHRSRIMKTSRSSLNSVSFSFRLWPGRRMRSFCL